MFCALPLNDFIYNSEVYAYALLVIYDLFYTIILSLIYNHLSLWPIPGALHWYLDSSQKKKSYFSLFLFYLKLTKITASSQWHLSTSYIYTPETFLGPEVTVQKNVDEISILVNHMYCGREREIICLYHVTISRCLKIYSHSEKTISVWIREYLTLTLRWLIWVCDINKEINNSDFVSSSIKWTEHFS